MATTLDGFETSTFTHDAKTRTVYKAGSGPAVIVITEMPGITPDVFGFARRVVDIGCTAVVPHVFGDPGRKPSPLYTIESIVPACVSKEFTTWALGKTSPITSWLRALAAQAHEECGGPGVGVVGMCFTGGFALGMMVDDRVLAPVLSQPSLPIAIGAARKRDIGISPDDLARVKERVRDGVCVIGLRFTGDKLAPAERFQHLRDELGDGFVAVEIDSSKGNPYHNPRNAHSVLTLHLVDEPGHPTREALDKVLDLFRTRLLGASG
jgi:dienelactone hydrolase